MYTNNTVKSIIIAFIVMIGITGIGAAINTNVVYNGDGQYNCDYDAEGTGYIGIHTYTSDGTDHLTSSWINSQSTGCQEMNTYSGTEYSATLISREVTVGGVGDGKDENGFIYTHTTDNEGNYITSNAVYHDNKGYSSHVTTNQSVIVGNVDDVFETDYDVTGIVAFTNIHGYSYGIDTVVSGSTTTQSGDAYTYTSLYMYDGRMNIQTHSITGNIPDENHGASSQIVTVDDYTKGIGVFSAGSGTDMHSASFWMEENEVNNIEIWTDTSGSTMYMTTTFNGNFDATGYIYAIDMPNTV